MPVKYLTVGQHQQLLQRLNGIGRSAVECVKGHQAGFEYTSLMMCFLLHNMGATETLLHLAKSFGNEWFPTTIGYVVDRSIFEVHINAHYITKDRANRSRQYIEYGRVIKKNQLDAFVKHLGTHDPTRHEFIRLAFEQGWSSRAQEINEKYDAVKKQFEGTTKKGKRHFFQNWSGKSIREMAQEVDHEIEYDIFYAEMSSFTHADVKLADRFLHTDADGPLWTRRADEYDVGNVFRYAAMFFSCFLQLFGTEFEVWTEQDVGNCWEFGQETV